MSQDSPARCVMCNTPVPSSEDEVWLWESGTLVGPVHPRCADDCLADDPDRYSRKEPEEDV